jgi:hypothetical protein
LRPIFRAVLWGAAVLLLGNAFQAAWLSTLPTLSLLEGSVDVLPGSLARAAPGLLPAEGPAALLARQLTVFDLAWPVVVALTLDLRPTVSTVRSSLSVAGAWAALVLTRWILFLYASGLA